MHLDTFTSSLVPLRYATSRYLLRLVSNNYCDSGVVVALPVISNDKCDQHVLGCTLAHVCSKVQCTKISFRRGGVCVCFLKSVRKARFRNVWVGGGGGRWSQFCTKSCKRTDTQGTGNALRITHYSDILSGAPSFWCISGDLHVSHFAPNRRRCRLPETHVVKPWWGALYDPKTGMQRQWPLQWTESGVPCGSRQVAANRLYEAFWPAWQAPGSPSPNLHPQSVLFFAPKVSMVHQGKQQHVA